MKTNRWNIFPFLCILMLSSCTSCNEPIDPTVLPAETQSGKNTFGCYVNNELYVGGFSNLTGPISLSAIYNRNTKGLFIISYGKLKNNYQQIINIELNSPVEGTNQHINKGYYESQDVNKYAYYSVSNAGEMYLTKIDTVNKIVSGRFGFVGKSSNLNLKSVSNDSIVITDGRFDLKLTFE